MGDFRTSLLREKFTITDLESPDPDAQAPILALSNRLVVPLISKDKIDIETFVIRNQNMHSCARFAAAILKEFHDNGTIANRVKKFKWDDLWYDVTKGYEKEWNPDIWCTVYYKGRLVFESGKHHPFLDIIEQCDAVNEGEYTQSVVFAETAFKQAGKTVKIDHESNIALVTAVDAVQAKCGVIVRSATGATTFNLTAKQKENGRILYNFTLLSTAAAFLEGIQLAFQVGMFMKKQELNMIEAFSDDYKKGKRSEERLANLNRAITSFEQYYIVQYRPDRPEFKKMVDAAESLALKILEPQIKKMIEDGELDNKDWVI